MSKVTIRQLKKEDATLLARYANNKKIFDNLKDYFPFPYSLQDANDFIEMKLALTPLADFAICENDEFVGVIGCSPQRDIYRDSALMGYWIGEPHWGKGIATRAVIKIIDHAFNQLDLKRLYSSVFEYNPASMRVLEKAGFHREGVARKSIIKNEVYYDELKFGLLNPKYFPRD